MPRGMFCEMRKYRIGIDHIERIFAERQNAIWLKKERNSCHAALPAPFQRFRIDIGQIQPLMRGDALKQTRYPAPTNAKV